MTIQEQIPTHEQPLEQEETLEREVRAVLSDNPAAITKEVRSLTLRALTEGTHSIKALSSGWFVRWLPEPPAALREPVTGNGR
jgi:hypothetical protein